MALCATDPAAQEREIRVLTPGSLAGYYDAGSVLFGPEPGDGVTGELVPVGQEADSTDQACEPISDPTVVGSIALIRRGNCLFVEKVRHAQQAGAIAVLIYNNQPPGSPGDTTLTMAGDGPDITIPSGFLTGHVGRMLRDASPGVTLRLQDAFRCYGPTTGEPDPADPEEYYPLSVGNVWEYRRVDYLGHEECSRSRLDVLRDTVVEATNYYLVREASYDCENPRALGHVSRLMRFDDTLARVVVRGSDGQETAWTDTRCPLDADFGVMLPDGCDSYSWEVERVGTDQKSYSNCWRGSADLSNITYRYQQGRGLVARAEENLGGYNFRTLEYSRVDGVEQGTSTLWPVSTEAGPVPEGAPEGLYPNPARQHVTVTFALDRPQPVMFEVFDALGRRVFTHALGPRPRGHHEATVSIRNLASGAYVLRVFGREGYLRSYRLVRLP